MNVLVFFETVESYILHLSYMKMIMLIIFFKNILYHFCNKISLNANIPNKCKVYLLNHCNILVLYHLDTYQCYLSKVI